MGSNPGAVCWMDLTFFHIVLLQKIYEKEADIGPFKN